MLGLPATPAADVFSIAATVVRLATGRHPFGEKQREILMAIGGGAQARVDDVALGAVAAAALRRALDPDAAKRPSADELARALVVAQA